MRLASQRLAATLTSCILVSAVSFAKSATTNEVLVRDQNQFAVSILQNTIAAEGLEEKNAFMSPYSISTAMAMVYMGSAADTQLELAKGLNVSLPASLIPGLYSQQLSDLTAEKGVAGYDLQLANHFWAQEGFGFLPEYTAMLENEFEAGITEYDFKVDAEREQAILDINNWADQNTNGKITKVVDDKTITKRTRFVLTNAIYFLGDWLRPFPRQENHKPKLEDFTLPSGETVDVDYMSQIEYFNYFSNNEVAAVELPYGKPMRDLEGNVVVGWDGEPRMQATPISMWVVLPQQGQTLSTMVSRLHDGKLANIFMNAKAQDVFVKMPPFKFEAEYKLKKTMTESMGMPLAFSGIADFSGMNGRKDLMIGEVIHKTFVRVDNKGTEAAAVTAVVGLEITSAEPKLPVDFIANKPFLYLIRDNQTGAILFMGTMNDPSINK